MKQILQNLSNGQTELAEVPCPRAKPEQLLIRTRASLVSAGTKRMLVDFGKANLTDKACQEPDQGLAIRSTGIDPFESGAYTACSVCIVISEEIYGEFDNPECR